MEKDSMQHNSTNSNPDYQDFLSHLQYLQDQKNEMIELRREMQMVLKDLDSMRQGLNQRAKDLKLSEKKLKGKEEDVKLEDELAKVGAPLVFATIIFIMFLVMSLVTLVALVWRK